MCMLLLIYDGCPKVCYICKWVICVNLIDARMLLTISAWHILARSLSSLVFPGADSPLAELLHKLQKRLQPEKETQKCLLNPKNKQKCLLKPKNKQRCLLKPKNKQKCLS